MDYRLGICSSCKARYEIPASFTAPRAKCKRCNGVVEIGGVISNGARAVEPAPAAPTQSSAPSVAPRIETPAPIEPAPASKPELAAKSEPPPVRQPEVARTEPKPAMRAASSSAREEAPAKKRAAQPAPPAKKKSVVPLVLAAISVVVVLAVLFKVYVADANAKSQGEVPPATTTPKMNSDTTPTKSDASDKKSDKPEQKSDANAPNSDDSNGVKKG